MSIFNSAYLLRLHTINNYCNSKINYDSSSQAILELIKKLKRYLFDKERYNSLLINNLINTLSVNKKISKKEKNNINFFVNALIVELYHYGYSLNHIKKIPDIITLRLNKRDFPYEKTLVDFNYDNKAYENYIERERAQMNLHKMLSGLINLIRYPKYQGYIIFKVDDVNLKEPYSLKIGDVEFYNPFFQKKLNEDIQPKNSVIKYDEVEKFSSGDNKNQKPSTCNAIIPIAFRISSMIRRSNEIIDAYQKLLQALEIINTFSEYYSTSGKVKGRVKFDNHFFVHKDGKLAEFSLSILTNCDDIFEINHSEDKKKLIEDLSYYNKLHSLSPIGEKVYYILSTVSEIQNRDEFFNFNKLWTGWESIMPGKKPQDKLNSLLELTQSCIKIYLRNKFIYKIANLLEFSLNIPTFFDKKIYYFLEIVTLQEIGLYRGSKLKKFKNKYSEIRKYIDNEIVNFYLDKLTFYLNKNPAFFSDVNLWIENVIKEVYLERNMEVHKNKRSEFGQLKLKDDFIWLSIILIKEIAQNINSRNKQNFSQIIASIKVKADKL